MSSKIALRSIWILSIVALEINCYVISSDPSRTQSNSITTPTSSSTATTKKGSLPSSTSHTSEVTNATSLDETAAANQAELEQY